MVEELSLSRASSEQQTENNAPRRTLELQADEATEGWRKLRNEELHDFVVYCLPDYGYYE